MANSVANFFYNGFGYLPAPYLYGLVADATKVMKHGENVSRWGMFMLMYSSAIGVTSMSIAVCLNASSRKRAARMAKESYGGAFTKRRIAEILDEISIEN